MDQHRVAGLGNLLTDEILWRAGLDPHGRPAAWTTTRCSRLHRHIRTGLDRMWERGGSHTGDLQDARHAGRRVPEGRHAAAPAHDRRPHDLLLPASSGLRPQRYARTLVMPPLAPLPRPCRARRPGPALVVVGRGSWSPAVRGGPGARRPTAPGVLVPGRRRRRPTVPATTAPPTTTDAAPTEDDGGGLDFDFDANEKVWIIVGALVGRGPADAGAHHRLLAPHPARPAGRRPATTTSERGPSRKEREAPTQGRVAKDPSADDDESTDDGDPDDPATRRARSTSTSCWARPDPARSVFGGPEEPRESSAARFPAWLMNSTSTP